MTKDKDPSGFTSLYNMLPSQGAVRPEQLALIETLFSAIEQAGLLPETTQSYSVQRDESYVRVAHVSTSPVQALACTQTSYDFDFKTNKFRSMTGEHDTVAALLGQAYDDFTQACFHTEPVLNPGLFVQYPAFAEGGTESSPADQKKEAFLTAYKGEILGSLLMEQDTAQFIRQAWAEYNAPSPDAPANAP